MCLNSSFPPSSLILQPQSYEAVEPLDLEEFLLSQLRSGDSALMQELGDFPDDDLKVEQVEKECRTVRHSVPKDGWVTACLTLTTEESAHSEILRSVKKKKDVEQ